MEEVRAVRRRQYESQKNKERCEKLNEILAPFVAILRNKDPQGIHFPNILPRTMAEQSCVVREAYTAAVIETNALLNKMIPQLEEIDEPTPLLVEYIKQLNELTSSLMYLIEHIGTVGLINERMAKDQIVYERLSFLDHNREALLNPNYDGALADPAPAVDLTPDGVVLVSTFLDANSRLALRKVSQSWRHGVDKIIVTQSKFAAHFPDVAKKIAENNNPKINWTREFIKTEKIAYKGFNKKTISLFRAVKNKDMVALRAIKDIRLADLVVLLKVRENVAGQRTVLDHCIVNGFQKGADFLSNTARPYISTWGKRIHLAIRANQPLAKVRDEFNQAFQEGASFYDSTKEKLFYSACKLGRLDVVNYLIDNRIIKASLLNKDPSYMFIVCRMGHLALLHEFLEKRGVNPNQRTSSGQTPLCVALVAGHSELAKLLLKHGANSIGAPDSVGRTILHELVTAGRLEGVRMVLDRFSDKVDIDARIHSGHSPLHVACEKGYLSIVKELLARGADAKARTHLGASLLHTACYNGHLDIVQELLARGEDVNAKMQDDASPLHVACEQGHLEVVQELLARGADVNAKTREGHTPLTEALHRQRSPVVKLLLERPNIEVNAEFRAPTSIKFRRVLLSTNKFNAFDYLQDTKDLEVARKLLENGLIPLGFERFDAVRPVLTLAREQNNVEMVKNLLLGLCNAYLALKEKNVAKYYRFRDKTYESIFGFAVGFFGAKTDNASKCAAVKALKENLEKFDEIPNDLTQHLSAAEPGSNVRLLYQQYVWLCEKRAAVAHEAPVRSAAVAP